MKARTLKQVDAKLRALRAARVKAGNPAFREKLDAMIYVLERPTFKESDVDSRFMPDETDVDYDESEQEVYRAAQDALKWRQTGAGELI